MSENALPQHVSIIMDGNGRWANSRQQSKTQGHAAGYEALRNIVEYASEKKIKVLSVFAFSTENWCRPEQEIDGLMELFLHALDSEVESLKQNNVRLKFIGNLSAFSTKIQQKMSQAENLTCENTGLQFVIAANYGGRWDITQAVKHIALQAKDAAFDVDSIDEDFISNKLSSSGIPDPDLFIRTSGEIRISNFFLWQLAYTECYFTDKLWPDFDKQEFEKALTAFQQRNRRYGQTSRG